MPSTIAQLCLKLKSSPNELKVLPQICNLLLSDQIDQQSKLFSIPEIDGLFRAYFQKISPAAQSKTYQYLCAHAEKYSQILLFLAEEQDCSDYITNLHHLILACPEPEKMIAKIVELIITEAKIDWSALRNAELLTKIIDQLQSKVTEKTNSAVIKFIFALSHFNELETDSFSSVKKPEEIAAAFKKAYQTILIECLKLVDR